jgi:hypothetical protein
MDTDTLVAVHELVGESVNALYRYEDKPSAQSIGVAQMALSKALSLVQSAIPSDSLPGLGD